MSKLNDLIEKYPLLFTNNDQEPFAQFGFECGEGWYNILHAACESIYAPFRSAKRNVEWYAKGNSHESKQMEAAIDALDACQSALPVFAQIKEKFGSLRIYYDGGDDRAQGIIDFAEIMSETTCQTCGDAVDRPADGFKRIPCKKHTPKQQDANV